MAAQCRYSDQNFVLVLILFARWQNDATSIDENYALVLYSTARWQDYTKINMVNSILVSRVAD
jgi:hypothetical protein